MPSELPDPRRARNPPIRGGGSQACVLIPRGPSGHSAAEGLAGWEPPLILHTPDPQNMLAFSLGVSERVSYKNGPHPARGRKVHHSDARQGFK